MTDLVFYAELDALALELLNEFGSLATVRRIVVSKPDSTGKVTKTPSDLPGLAVQTMSQTVMEMLNDDVTVALVYKGPREAINGDHIIHGQNTWEVKDIKNVNPTGSALMIQFLGCVKP